MNIGNTEIPFVSDVISTKDVPHDEIKALGIADSILVNHEPGVELFTMEFILTEFFHSTGKDLDEQVNDVRALQEQDWDQNDIDFLGYDGFISVEEVQIDRAGEEPGMRPGVINGFYLPKPEYSSS